MDTSRSVYHMDSAANPICLAPQSLTSQEKQPCAHCKAKLVQTNDTLPTLGMPIDAAWNQNVHRCVSK